MAKQKRQLKITVQGKSPNTVTIGITHSARTEDSDATRTLAVATSDDFAIGSALHEGVSKAVADFIGVLQEDEGPTLFGKGKKAAEKG